MVYQFYQKKKRKKKKCGGESLFRPLGLELELAPVAGMTGCNLPIVMDIFFFVQAERWGIE